MTTTLRNVAKALPLVPAVYRSCSSLLGRVWCTWQFFRFVRLSRAARRNFALRWKDCWFHWNDMKKSLPIEPHYTYHPAWAARIIATIKPRKHIDVSSILHFATILSAFVSVEYYEYRPPPPRRFGPADDPHCRPLPSPVP